MVVNMKHTTESRLRNPKFVLGFGTAVVLILLYFLIGYRNDGIMLKEKMQYFELSLRKFKSSNDKLSMEGKMCKTERVTVDRALTQLQESMMSKESDLTRANANLNECELNKSFGKSFFKGVKDIISGVESEEESELSSLANKELLTEVEKLKFAKQENGELKNEKVALKTELEQRNEGLNALHGEKSTWEQQKIEYENKENVLHSQIADYKNQMSRLHKEVQVLRELSDTNTNKRGFLVKPKENLTPNVKKIDSNSIAREELPTNVQTQSETTKTQNSNIIQETIAPKQSEGVIGEVESKSAVEEPATLPNSVIATEPPQVLQGEVQANLAAASDNVNTDDLLGESNTKKEVTTTTTIEKLAATAEVKDVATTNGAPSTDSGKEDHDSEETNEVNNADNDISNEDTKIAAVPQHSSLNELANEEAEDGDEEEEEEESRK